MIKSNRQQKITELISTQNISTQTELTNILISEGFDVTQATVSRDLGEMRVIKTLLPDGTYKYTMSGGGEIKINDKLQTVFEQCLISVDYAMNIVVLKTMSGAAQAVGYALDSFTWEEIVGSIAGDDTIMIVVRNEKSAKQLCFKNVVVLNKKYDLNSANVIAPAKDIVTLDERMGSGVAMYIRGTRAYADGSEQVRIDPKNSAVVPYTENGRTLIPVRFVAERFGADVGWEEETETVTIKLNEKTVILKIGETVFTVDGEERELDVPAKVENGRTLIPLRAVAEALDKKVFWDDRGLIIVSDDEFDKTNDKIFNEELVFLLRTN